MRRDCRSITETIRFFLRELPGTHPRATLTFKPVGKYSYITDSREQRRITEYKRKVGGSLRLRSSGLTICSHLLWRRRQQILPKSRHISNGLRGIPSHKTAVRTATRNSQIFQECRIPGCENKFTSTDPLERPIRHTLECKGQIKFKTLFKPKLSQAGAFRPADTFAFCTVLQLSVKRCAVFVPNLTSSKHHTINRWTPYWGTNLW